MLKLFLIITFTSAALRSNAQYVAHYTLDTKHKADTIVDHSTLTKFILDTSRIVITAIDANDKLLWKTDPWEDNKLDTYRVKRPIIARFYFANNQWTDNKESIWIIYNNTQFGKVDKKTGKFTWLGQD
jgi:hypothetical protein